jgi:hypothetical protein
MCEPIARFRVTRPHRWHAANAARDTAVSAVALSDQVALSGQVAGSGQVASSGQNASPGAHPVPCAGFAVASAARTALLLSSYTPRNG